jgi:acetyl-CoA carboxylase biotin carboxyl carrier protein
MPNDTFDIQRIKRLAELMQKNELTELDLQQGETRIQLKRNPIPCAPQPVLMPAVAAPISVTPQQTPTTRSASEPAEEKNVFFITSPMVGTFYTASKPDTPPFVSVGDTVSADKTVCIIEAMKVYNEIQAECSGKIIAVLVQNGEAVEFGKPLFKLQTDD